MASDKSPIYVFRGTTMEYPGNRNSSETPYTCTSTHPVKALWFALECYHRNPEMAVVYIALMEKMEGINRGFNLLNKLEDEIGFFIPPIKFYANCEGFIEVRDFQSVLKDFAIDAYIAVRKDNLSRLCKKTAGLSVKKIESLVKAMLPYLKK